MITTNKIGGSEVTKNAELCGLSTDTKPLEVPNGSIFTEIDTSNQYMFDKENENWVKMKSQSGGGSVSDVDASDVNYRGSNVKEALDDLSDRNASNILYDDYSTIYSVIGDIDELGTENKNLVDAVNEVFTSVSNGKELIADAISDKGIETSATDTFETMATNISNIRSGGLEIFNILTNSQISTTSVYKYPVYDMPIPTKKMMLKCVVTGDATAETYVLFDANTTSINIYPSINRSLNIQLKRDKVNSVSYNGSWINLYLTITAIDITDF